MSFRPIYNLPSTAFTSRAYGYGNCPRCGGSGYIHQYRHVEGGICFLCRGSGQYSSYIK